MRLWSESLREVAAQSLPLCPDDRLYPVGHLDPAEDVRQVRLHRFLADAEAVGDQLVRQPVEQQREDLALARRDPLERVQIGRASCRERECIAVEAESVTRQSRQW